MSEKEWSTFADGYDCKECEALEKELINIRKQTINEILDFIKEHQAFEKITYVNIFNKIRDKYDMGHRGFI